LEAIAADLKEGLLKKPKEENDAIVMSGSFQMDEFSINKHQ